MSNLYHRAPSFYTHNTNLRGSITVWLTSCLFYLELAAFFKLNEQQFYLFGQIQTSQKGGQPYSDTSPQVSVLWLYTTVATHLKGAEFYNHPLRLQRANLLKTTAPVDGKTIFSFFLVCSLAQESFPTNFYIKTLLFYYLKHKFSRQHFGALQPSFSPFEQKKN